LGKRPSPKKAAAIRKKPKFPTKNSLSKVIGLENYTIVSRFFLKLFFDLANKEIISAVRAASPKILAGAK
jgi:hypothetical protein